MATGTENVKQGKSPGNSIDKAEIIVYQTADQSEMIEVRIEDETVWLTQAQMSDLFQTTRNNITLHITNIFKESELERNSVCKDCLLTAQDGKNYKTKRYNLDVIISVGYRVKSPRGTQFRIWANHVLKEFLLKGYAIHQRPVPSVARDQRSAFSNLELWNPGTLEPGTG
jgi:hypothetical protein